MCKLFPSNRQKLRKSDCTRNKFFITSGMLMLTLGKSTYGNSIRHAKAIIKLIKFMSLNKSMQLKFHSLLQQQAKRHKFTENCLIYPLTLARPT